ncbi:hypothetical protein [Streptomyces flaveolus]
MVGDDQARGGLQGYAPGGKGKTVLDEIHRASWAHRPRRRVTGSLRRR